MEFTSFLPLPSFIIVLLFLCCSPSLVSSQQPYIGRNTTRCTNFMSPFPSTSSDFGYSCNGLNQSCDTYLIYRSYPPYNTIPAISKLLSVDPVRLSEINSVPLNGTVDTNRMLIVPIVCSCSGQYYQANTSYVVQHGDNYYLIVNGTYQGLASCRALKYQNPIETVLIYTGTNFTIPLRCACPTKNQTDKGIRYLLTYVVAENDFVSRISARFSVDTGRTLTANGLTEQSNLIFPFSTLLVPLPKPPLVSQTISPPPPPSQQPLSPPPLPLPIPSPANRSRTKWVYAIIGFLAGNAFVLVIGSVVLFKFLHYSRKVKSEKPSGVPEAISNKLEAGEGLTIKQISGEESDKLRMNISSVAQSIKVYSFEEIAQATDNFSSICCIKGSVHRGMIDGSYVAVKEMSGDAIKEIDILNKISHLNIIRLVGICFNDGHWYFVFEHAANGPLSDWIYRSREKIDGEILSCNRRIQIALDIAMGLNYLHCFTTPPLVHKNITSSNVLLDENFRAKITNFSTARPAKGDAGEFAMTMHIMGTKGYLAPEYLENGLVSTKLDVYAFGVLLVEMLTGKDVEELLGEGRTNLFEIVSDVIQSDDEEGMGNKSGDLVDPCLGGDSPDHQTIVLMKVIRQCLRRDPGGRPAMNEVVQSLSTVQTCTSIWELSSSFSF